MHLNASVTFQPVASNSVPSDEHYQLIQTQV